MKEVPPCVYGQPVIDYFNKPEVRKSLNILDSAASWDLCRSATDKPVGFDYTPNKAGSIDVYTQLKGKYRILKFSGDTDGAVPTQGT